MQRLTRTESDVARQILAYFLRNPDAADSAEGVARWRVMDEQVWTSVRETFAALRWLVAKGYLEEVLVTIQRHHLSPSCDAQRRGAQARLRSAPGITQEEAMMRLDAMTRNQHVHGGLHG